MEEGKGKDPPKVHWICQLGGELAPSLLGGIDAPVIRFRIQIQEFFEGFFIARRDIIARLGVFLHL